MVDIRKQGCICDFSQKNFILDNNNDNNDYILTSIVIIAFSFNFQNTFQNIEFIPKPNLPSLIHFPKYRNGYL